MAHTANLNGVFERLPAILKLHGTEKLRKRTKIIGFLSKKVRNIQEPHAQLTRRLALGLASFTVAGNSAIEKTIAEDNGFWLTGPLPVPTVNNKIANEETGTRSFLKKGVYIADIGTKNRRIRLKRTAFDLLALEDLIGQDAWNYFRKYLCLKSTVMYYDFDDIISAAPAEDKQTLTNLANRLFDSVETLEEVAKKKDRPQIISCYKDTAVILEEVMNRMA